MSFITSTARARTTRLSSNLYCMIAGEVSNAGPGRGFVLSPLNQRRYMAARPKTLFTSVGDEPSHAQVNMIYCPQKPRKWRSDLQHLSLRKHFELCQEEGFLVREKAMNILLHMKQCTKDETEYRRLLHGKQGYGKSAILNYIVSYYADSQAVVVYIPSVLFLTRRPITITSSTWMTGRFNQNHHAIKLMNDFWKMNQKALTNFKLSMDYKIDGKEYSKGSPLATIIRDGLGPFEFAEMENEPNVTDMYGIVLKELREQTHTNVVFCIDDFNALYNMSDIKDFFLYDLHAKQLTLIHQLRKIWDCDNPRVLKLGATSASGHKSRLPVGMITSKLIDKIGIEVKEYSRNEIKMMLEYYKYRNAIAFGSEKVDEVKLLTSGIPSEVLKICQFY